jgi:hypothetical protein
MVHILLPTAGRPSAAKSRARSAIDLMMMVGPSIIEPPLRQREEVAVSTGAGMWRRAHIYIIYMRLPSADRIIHLVREVFNPERRLPAATIFEPSGYPYHAGA